MAYSRVTRTRSGREALKYAEGEHGHNGNEKRNEFIGTVNMIPGVPFAKQMQVYWNKASAKHKCQVLRIVQSFSKNEFNPEDESDIAKSNSLGVEFAKTFYPNRQCVVFTQIDGKSGLVHNHIIVNDVEMNTFKGCPKEQYFYRNIEKWTDKVTRNYTELDLGEKAKDKISRTERTKREQGEYVWKDDLKQRVHLAMSKAISKEDFFKKLTEHGVDTIEKSSKKYGEYFTYELVDISSAPEGVKLPQRALKLRSYNMGFSYGKDALADSLKIRGYNESRVVSVEVTEKLKSESKQDGFTEWLSANNESYMSFDDNFHMEIDWGKYESLKAKYEAYKNGEILIEEENDTGVCISDEAPKVKVLSGEEDEKFERLTTIKKRDEAMRQALLKEQEKVEKEAFRRPKRKGMDLSDMVSKMQDEKQFDFFNR